MPTTNEESEHPMTEPNATLDAGALDQIAGLLGLYNTDPGNNPAD